MTNGEYIHEIHAARGRIAPHIRRTALERNRTLSELAGTNVYLKLELFQPTGSFKVRGAFNKLLGSDLAGVPGVIAVSGGNHAQAVAYAATKLGVRSVILMPRSTPSNYLDATRGYGAEIDLTENIGEAFARLSEYTSKGWTLVHPFDDPVVIAGQGTTGLEIMEQAPQTTDIFASIGGGGLVSGIAMAAKSARADVRVWGVETEGADAMARALAAGEVYQMPAITSIARTLGAPAVTPRTLDLARRLLEQVFVVPDDTAIAGMKILMERAKLVVEPATGCVVGALLREKARFGPADHVVVVVCGGNVGLRELAGWLAR